MSQMIQHYQTSFSIVAPPERGEIDILYQAQFLMGEWVKAHEGKRFRDAGRNPEVSFLIDGSFKKRTEYRSKYSWLKTDYCIMSKSTAWAMEYTHRDAKEKNVYWVSEIGLRYFGGNNKLVVSVKISYKISTEYALTGRNFSPDVSIPWCVAGLIESFDDCRFHSGGRDITVCIGKPVFVTNDETLNDLENLLPSPDRKLAIVLLCGDSRQLKDEAAFLAKNMFAKALVYVVPYQMSNPKFRSFIKRYGMVFQECRFVPPFTVYDRTLQDSLKYRVNIIDEAKGHRATILRTWLGIHPVNEQGGVSDVANVQLLLRRELYAKVVQSMKQYVPKENFEKIKQDLDEMSGLFMLSEEENKKAREEKKKLADRVDELEIKKEKLEEEKKKIESKHATEIFNIQMKQQGVARKTLSNMNVLPREYPDKLIGLKAFERFYGNLLFAVSAWSSAEEYSRRFEEVRIAWEMLYDLDQVLWQLIFDDGSINVAKEFNSKSRFEYAAGEGRMTTRDNELAATRKFEYQGKTYEMWKHLKYSNRTGKQLRIYFDIDHVKRKLIVGHIGDHLDNATTRTIH